MVGLNGYTISSGIISSALNDEKIVAIPLKVDETITLGYIKRKKIASEFSRSTLFRFIKTPYYSL